MGNEAKVTTIYFGSFYIFMVHKKSNGKSLFSNELLYQKAASFIFLILMANLFSLAFNWPTHQLTYIHYILANI